MVRLACFAEYTDESLTARIGAIETFIIGAALSATSFGRTLVLYFEIIICFTFSLFEVLFRGVCTYY